MRGYLGIISDVILSRLAFSQQCRVVSHFLRFDFVSYLVPGKPPTNITPLALSPSSIAINWNLLQSNHCEIFPLLGFRVFYSFRNKENAMVTHSVNVNKSINNVVIQDLENFEYYLIWVQAITSRDLGPKSKAVKTRTLEQGKSRYWFVFK